MRPLLRRRRRETGLFTTERPPRLVLRFAIVVSLALALASALILVVVHRYALTQAERAATRHAGLVASSLLQREVRPEDLERPVPARRRAELDRVFRTHLVADDVTGIALVRRDGLVTYASEHAAIGTSRGRELSAEAASGTIVSAIEQAAAGSELATYAPVARGAREGAALITQSYAPIEASAREVQLRVGIVLEALLVVLFAALVPLLVRVTRRIKRQLDRIHRQAYYDDLTSLPNRPHLFERLEVAVARARERERRLAVLVLGLNRFREINETLGHEAGDAILAETASRLDGARADASLVARLGGDEFAVVTEYASEDELEGLVNGLRAAVEPPLAAGDVQVALESTVGIARFPEDGTDAGTLLKHAEIAVHTAKQWRVPSLGYSPAVDPHDPEQIGLAAALRTAAKDGELRVHYQPKVSLQTGAIVGFEALAYWQHPTRGLLPPGAFVPVAERTGVIGHISRAVLGAAIAQLAEWDGPASQLTISVNLTAIDLLDQRLPRRLQALLRRAGVDAGRLCIELTESTVMADPERAQGTLDRIAATGVRISIDDFGTGHSSLAYLKHLPAHEVKIDRDFVTDMTLSREDRLIVLATIKLAQSLGLRVVAEGVESEEVMNALRAIGCDYGQGYLFGRPQPAEEAARLVARAAREAA